MASSPLLPAWRRLHAFDRRIRGPEPSLTVLHLQPENTQTPLLLARIREEALRQAWSERNARILAAPPSLVEDEDALHETLKAAALVKGAIAPGWARVLAGIQGGAAWAVVETPRSTAVALAWIGPPEPLATAQDAADAQAALRAAPLPSDPKIPILPHPTASAHDRLRAAAVLDAAGAGGRRLAALLPDGGGGLEIRQAPGLRALLRLDRKGRPTAPLLLADVPTSPSP